MKRVAIVGGGQAAAVAVRTLRRRGFDGAIEIIAAEPHPPYQRPPLSKEFLAGDEDDLFLLPGNWLEANEVRLRTGQPAVRIDENHRAVELTDGTTVPADAVLIATGGRPRLLTAPGGQVRPSERVCYLRTLDDARRLRGHLRPGLRLIVVGAGFIGAEVAAAARAAAAEVTIIEALPSPMEPLLGPTAAAACAELHRANGTALLAGTAVESVTDTGSSVAVITGDHGQIEGDLAVIGIGMVPNDELAVRSGIAVAGGISTDQHCRTSVPYVYAAGDVARSYHPLFGASIRAEHFDNASRQAAAAVDNILGRQRAYDDPYWFWSDQYGVNLQYAGHGGDTDATVVRGDPDSLDFCVFYLRGGVLRAAFGVDRAEEITLARELIGQQAAVPPALLEDEETDLADIALSTGERA